METIIIGIIVGVFVVWVNINWLVDLIIDIKNKKKKEPSELAKRYEVETQVDSYHDYQNRKY